LEEYEFTTLKKFDGSRENNFTSLRILLAWCVLYGHSYTLQKTAGIVDPLNVFVFKGSTWIGEVALNGFFVISGFLVTASFIKRGLAQYTFSRTLRIFPALITCVFLSVFLLGPILTNLHIGEYFFNNETYRYLKNALGYPLTEWALPGVFTTNTNAAVNGSLWSLNLELRCYMLLAAAGVLGLLKNRTVANTFVLAAFLFGFFFFKDIPLVGINTRWANPCLYFLAGSFFYLNREKVIIDFKIALFLLVLALYSFGKPFFPYVFPACFVYLVFYLSYGTRYVPVDRKIGDISYGIYIYAWPVQQVVAQLVPKANPYINMVLSSIIVISIAYLSWRYIEKPMLSLKQKQFVWNIRDFIYAIYGLARSARE